MSARDARFACTTTAAGGRTCGGGGGGVRVRVVVVVVVVVVGGGCGGGVCWALAKRCAHTLWLKRASTRVHIKHRATATGGASSTRTCFMPSRMMYTISMHAADASCDARELRATTHVHFLVSSEAAAEAAAKAKPASFASPRVRRPACGCVVRAMKQTASLKKVTHALWRLCHRHTCTGHSSAPSTPAAQHASTIREKRLGGCLGSQDTPGFTTHVLCAPCVHPRVCVLGGYQRSTHTRGQSGFSRPFTKGTRRGAGCAGGLQSQVQLQSQLQAVAGGLQLQLQLCVCVCVGRCSCGR